VNAATVLGCCAAQGPTRAGTHRQEGAKHLSGLIYRLQKRPYKSPSSRFKAEGRWGKHKGQVQHGNKTSQLAGGRGEAGLGDASRPAPEDSPAAGTWLGWDVPDGSAWGETQQCRLLPRQRDSPAPSPSPSHPTASLRIKSIQLGEPGENKLSRRQAAPQKEGASVQGQVLQRPSKAALSSLPAKPPRRRSLLPGRPHASQGWEGHVVDHEAGQGQHCGKAHGRGFWRCFCPLPPNSRRKREMRQKGKGIGAPGGMCGSHEGQRDAGGAGRHHGAAAQGWLAASQEAEIGFFSQLVSDGGSGGGRAEAEQIAVVGLREARELERGRRCERGSPTRTFAPEHPKPSSLSRRTHESPTRRPADTEQQEGEEAWAIQSQDTQSPPPCTRILREDVQAASAPQAPLLPVAV